MSIQRKFLFIGAHPDDETLVAGTLLKLAKKGWKTYVIICTGGEGMLHTSSDKADLKNVRKTEADVFAKEIGLEKLYILNGTDGFLTDNDNLLKKLVQTIREIAPDITAIHFENDYHHDHRSVNSLGKHAIELAYRNCLPELGPRLRNGIFLQTDGLNLLSNPLITINVSDTHAESNKATIKAYGDRLGSQLLNFSDGVRLARGSRVNVGYGEVYDLINPEWYRMSPDSAKVLAEFIELGA